MPMRPHERVDYDAHQHAVYETGRRMLPETRRLWVDASRRHLAGRPVRTLLDLGSGTGRFADVLATGLAVAVVGVEPADRMRARAQAHHPHPRVTYLRGTASGIPLADGSVDAAWLSMVVHHLPDLAAAAREIHRVVAPRGRVLVRSAFRGRLESFRMYRFFPTARAADEARLPPLEHVRGAFEAAGLRFCCLDVVRQVVDRTWAEHIERTRQRAQSSFEYISDEEFETGLRAMEAAGRRGEPEPVTEDIDLLVFERP